MKIGGVAKLSARADARALAHTRAAFARARAFDFPVAQCSLGVSCDVSKRLQPPNSEK